MRTEGSSWDGPEEEVESLLKAVPSGRERRSRSCAPFSMLSSRAPFCARRSALSTSTTCHNNQRPFQAASQQPPELSPQQHRSRLPHCSTATTLMHARLVVGHFTKGDKHQYGSQELPYRFPCPATIPVFCYENECAVARVLALERRAEQSSAP